MTPPTTPGVISSAATLPEEEVAVALSGGLHGRVFGPAIGAVDGRLRLGLREGFELSLNAGAYIVVQQAEGEESGEHRGLYTGRAGLKIELHRNIALVAGLGGGLSPAAGFFVGGDLGFVFAYENPYCIPFVALRGFYSVPIRPSLVDTGVEDAADFARPADTGGGTLELGLRVPVGRERRFNLMLSGMVTALYDGRGGLIEDANTLWLTGFMTGVEARFGGAPAATPGL
jgi:hypothetical protein